MFGRATTRRGASILLHALLVGAALAGEVRAAEPPPQRAQADELMRQGVELRRQTRNSEALEVFLKAQAIAPSASVLAQIGSVELSLGHWVDAEGHLEQALARHDAPWSDVPKNREMLERTLAEARKRIARIDVRGTRGADLAIDGKRAGTLPLPAPVHVAAGTIRLTVKAAGHQPLEKTMTLVGGEEAIVAAELVPVPVLAPLSPAVVAQPVAPAPEVRHAPAWRGWTGGALAVAGIAAIGTGITWIALDGRTNCNPPPGGFCEQVYDTGTRGWITLGAGVVAIGVGTTLFLWKGKEVSGTVAVAPGGVAIRGQF